MKKTEIIFEGYRLFDVCVFDNIIKSLGCPQCHSTNTLYVEEIDSKRKGLASCLLVKCLKCTYASCLLVKCLKCTYASCLLVKCLKCTYAMLILLKLLKMLLARVTSKNEKL